MNITEDNLNETIDLLNNLICDENLLTRTERLDLVRAVAAIGAMKARVAILSSQKSSSVKRVEKRKKRLSIHGFQTLAYPGMIMMSPCYGKY
jgi:hypothetical protein